MKKNDSKTPYILIILLDLLVFFLLTAADLFTKHLAVLHLKDSEPIVLIPGALQLRYLENRGAAFGVLQNQRIFFAITGIAFLLAVVWYLKKIPAESKYRVLRAVLVVVAAGDVGNLIDRVRLGYVVDFIYFSLINFPIFNVADIYVTVGTAVLFILVIFVYKEEDLEIFKKKQISDEGE